MVKMLIGACVGLAMSIMAGTVNATVIFENPVSAGETSGLSSDGVNFQAFNYFVLQHDATLTDVHWYGSITVSSPLNFTISIYESNGSLPNLTSQIYTENVTAVKISLPTETYDGFEVDPISSIVLIGETEYWISIVSPTFAWVNSSVAPGSEILAATLRFSDRALYGQVGRNLAFSLTSTTVPLPPTISLFAVGLAALGALSRRREKRAEVG